MKYLILDKRQRVETDKGNGISTASNRLIEELEKKDIEYHFSYYDQLEFELIDGETTIKANSEDITKFTNIILRGHALHKPREYQAKRMIVNHIEYFNKQNRKKILVQNGETIKLLPYYNKIYLGQFCLENDIPYFDTYFRMDGNYLTKRDVLKEYPLIIKEYAGVNRTEKIDGKLKIKKNVYKLDDPGSFNQEHLKDQNLSNFFIQEFSPTAKDMRIFVQNGKVVAGWIRQAKDGFMTVSHGEYSMYNKPDREIKKIAEKVAKKLKANFIAVDLMFIDDKPYLQEISLHPGFKAYENKTPGKPINIAKTIIESF